MMKEQYERTSGPSSPFAEKKRVIIADDDPTTRVVVRQSLEQQGYEVITCHDGHEVLASLQVLTNPPELFILDIGMPRLDGFATCQEIRRAEEQGFLQRQDGKPVPVLFVSAYDTLENRRRGFALKSIDFLAKPVTRETVASAVDEILNPRDHYAGAIALVVDDDPVVRLLVSQTLRKLGLTVLEAQNGSQAYRLLEQQKKAVDLILVDYRMEAMQGDELIFLLRQLDAYRHVPMIAMSGDDDREAVLTMFRLGANDYLVKPFIHEELLARVRVHLNARLYQRQLEEVNDNLFSLAVQDELTGLYNRRYLTDWCLRSLASHRRQGESLALLLFDLDYFKSINDRFGHSYGDHVLREIGALLKKIVRAGDLCARYGGEEYVVVLPHTRSGDAVTVAERIRVAIAGHVFSQMEMRNPVTVSIGLTAGVPEEDLKVEDLLDQADQAMYQAKQSGRNRVCVYKTGLAGQ